MTPQIRSIIGSIRTRLRRFFLGGDELVFESAMQPEALKEKIYETLRGTCDYTAGANGHVLGASVHVGWSFGWVSRRSTPVFHGRIESTAEGSQLRGRISAGRFVQLFMAIWFGGVAIFSLLFVWTLFMPVAGIALIWLGSHFVGDDEAEKQITNYLTSVCGESGQMG
jgi:hypothetical protein